MAKSNFNTVNTLTNTLVNNMDCHVAWSSKFRSSAIYYPSLIHVKTVEQINQDYDNSISKVSNVYESVPPVYEEYTDSRDSTPSPGRLYIDESRENLTTSSPLTLPNNDEYSEAWSSTTRIPTTALLSPIINDLNDEIADSRDYTPSPGRLYIDESMSSPNTADVEMNEYSDTWFSTARMPITASLRPINDFRDEYDDSRDSTPSPGRLYIDESMSSPNIADVEMNECSVTWSLTTRMSVIAPFCPINYFDHEYADSRDSTPSPGRLYIDESMSSPNTADVEMNEYSDTWSSTTRMPITAPLRPINDFSNEYADSRDSTPSPGRLYIDESMSSPNTADVEMNESSETWSSTARMPITVPLRPINDYNDTYADSHHCTPSPGRLYNDESKDSENLSMYSPITEDIKMNECSETRSSVTTHLCPIQEPALLMDVKTVKKEYEKFFPYHPQPKLRRQRLNAYRDA
ncbi:uncharacterized protein [Choristoneura fumiferana]|uniref:uncharacterized protein n=1 Tax=Choristoneura fumiferana TaxID=7141 RepID=UPI003D15D56D